MKRFRFSLQTLLRVKKQREQQAAARAAAARQEVEACHGRVGRLREELGGVARRVELLMTGTPAEGWAGLFEQAARLDRALHAAEVDLARAEGGLRQAAEARRRLAAEVEALKTLRRQQWEVYRRDHQRVEQERLDELGMRKWNEARRQTEPDPRAAREEKG